MGESVLLFIVDNVVYCVKYERKEKNERKRSLEFLPLMMIMKTEEKTKQKIITISFKLVNI